jgi:nucleotide-binding universal stress UspA family protein
MVLAAVEETDGALRAASYAAGLARRTGSRLLLVHVRPSLELGICAASFLYAGPLDLGPPNDTRFTFLTRLRAAIEEEYGIDVDTEVLDGLPTAEIARLADELRADAVVVGSPRSLRHRIAGSVPVRLVRHGNWPVTVVP